jgi:hypothetical protein
VNAGILWWFHDRHWYPSDEGIYGHIAERLLAGEVMNRDVQNFHPGYVDFVNAAALHAFGMDLLSMRYPLAAVAFIQAVVVYRLIARRSLMLAAVGSVAVTALGVVQFLNPTANWYCLSLVTVLASWMMTTPREHARRLIVAGVLVGLVGLFRQLTGVFVVFGVLVAILRERSSTDGRRGFLAPALLILILASLLLHLGLSREAQAGGLVLFAAAPVAITGALLLTVRARDRDVAMALLQLCTGGVVAALPLVAYWVVHGSFSAWLSDVVIEAAQFTDLSFLGGGSWYAALPVAALYQAVFSLSPAGIANGFYWSTVSILAAWNGVVTLRRMRSSAPVEDLTLPILAAFYGLVAMFMENAIYLHFTAGMSLCSILWLNASAPLPARVTIAVVSALLAIVALVYHAGQSSMRGGRELLAGTPAHSAITSAAFFRNGLRLDPEDREPYRAVAEVIRRETAADDTILALPSDAILYFLADRRNPTRFYNSAVGITRPETLTSLRNLLERQPPKLVTFRPADKFNTDASLALMAEVRARYELVEVLYGVEIYRRRDRP